MAVKIGEGTEKNMKARSAKAKGSKLERKVAEEYRRIGIEARRMPLSGAFTHLKADIFKPVKDGWHDECKNQETVNLRDWWAQTTRTCGQNEPALHISANFRPIITAIWSDTFDNMLIELSDSGQNFIHTKSIIDKKKLNLWDEWDKVRNCGGLGDPLLVINHHKLTVMSIEHYMELRDCLNNK